MEFYVNIEEKGRSMSVSDKEPKKQPSDVREQMETYNEFERYEMIDFIKYEMKPAPTFDHQKMLGNLNHIVRGTCHPDGEVVFAPVDVYLDQGNLLQPDLIFILHEHMGIVRNGRIEGAPDLVAEILSPSTSANDKKRKKAQYERFGVKEYWIVDPVHRTVDQFVLTDSKYELRDTYVPGDVLTSPLFSCVLVDMNELFEC